MDTLFLILICTMGETRSCPVNQGLAMLVSESTIRQGWLLEATTSATFALFRLHINKTADDTQNYGVFY